MSSTSYYRSPFGDTTYTKVFVGGLAWETQTDEMRRYFEQFGEILEAVIICDKTTGKSKGYGFVTFREAESATRAVADPNPMIDGRKANCNIASFGRPRPSPPRGRGQGGGHSQYQGGAQSSYTAGIAAPAAQFMYQQYGFTYNPEYGYHQALYNAQLQQAHYYQQQQMYGGVISQSSSSSLSSSLSSTIMPSPYYYGPRPYPHHHHQHQHQRLPSSLSPSASSYLVYPNFENSSFAPPTDRPLISSSIELQEGAEEIREGGEMEAPESTSREMTSSPLSN